MDQYASYSLGRLLGIRRPLSAQKLIVYTLHELCHRPSTLWPKRNLPSLVLIFSKKLYILLISRLACSIRSPMSSGTGVICDRPQNKRSVSTMFANSKSLANSVFGTL